MRTTDDLRAVLIARETNAPTVEDVLDTFTTGVHPFAPRRRRWLVPAAVAALVAGVTTLGAGVFGGVGGAGRHQTAASGPPLQGQFGFSVGAVSGFTFTQGTIAQGVQWRGIATASGVQVGMIEEGDSFGFSASSLTERQTVTVSGHLAYYGQQALEEGTSATGNVRGSGEWVSTVPTVAWQPEPGRWLVISASPDRSRPVDAAVIRAWGTDARAQLMTVADAVDTDAPAVMMLPFRIGSTHPHATALIAESDTGPRTPGGSAVLAEYGMEVTVEVSEATAGTSDNTSGQPVTIGEYSGRVDTRCSIQQAPAPGTTPAHSDCQLTFQAGRWQVAIYVNGPGGGSRKITPAQFVDIGEHLTLAAQPSNPATWFDASTAIPR
ncbi:MAG: hypothetical protein ACRDV3_01610 [Acidothermaceae bacterium]